MPPLPVVFCLGLALNNGSGWTVIPLIQHFLSYNGADINMTATRLIAIQSLPERVWVKYDLIVPFDWENDAIPATVEVQLGKMFNKSFGLYAEVAPVWVVIVLTTGAWAWARDLCIDCDLGQRSIWPDEWEGAFISFRTMAIRHHSRCIFLLIMFC